MKSSLQAVKVRSVVNMLSNYASDQDALMKRIELLEVAVEKQRFMTSLGSTVSAECLATAIDMLRPRLPFAIRPNCVDRNTTSVLIQDLQAVEVNMDVDQGWDRVYKHFEGQSYVIYKASSL